MAHPLWMVMFSIPINLCLLGIYGPVFVLVAAIRAAEHEENGKPTGAATSGGIYMGNDTTANNK
jgi:hypothetical protein